MTEATKRGRPRTRPLPEPPAPSRTIYVYDERFAGEPLLVGVHKNVPGEWPRRELLERYGIGAHLFVYEGDERRMLHRGERYGERHDL